MTQICEQQLLDLVITHMSLQAKEAMMKEITLTPKPGLVDLHNNGSHLDMNPQTFYDSINAIEPFLKEFLDAGVKGAFDEPTQTFLVLRGLGQGCEAAMFKATKGVNTYKGMIFSQAVILGSAGRVIGRGNALSASLLQEEIKQVCAGLVQRDLCLKARTAGERFFVETKDGGIREEAQKGYPILFQLSLPNFKIWKEMFGEEIALKKTLLLLMSHLNDTTLWSRGGIEGLFWAKEKAKNALYCLGGSLDGVLYDLDEQFIARHLSPGGSADMLAMTWLLDALLNNKES